MNYRQCWLFQCTNPECGTPGVVNDVVLNHRYKDGVPCPYCGQEMQMVREALETEYDPEMQDAFAAREMEQTQYKLIPPAKTSHHATSMSGQSILSRYGSDTQTMTPLANPENLGQKEKSENDLLTEKDVSQILHISVTAVRRLVRENKLRSIRFTKRKKAFTWALIDEFIRRESGISVPQKPGIANITNPRPRQSMSVEESRALVKKMRKKIESDKEHDEDS